MAEHQPEGQPEIFPDVKPQSDAGLPDHSPEEAAPSSPSDQSNAPALKASSLLRDLNEDLLRSGKFTITGKFETHVTGYVKYDSISSLHSFDIDLLSLFIFVTGTVDRLGRGLVFTEAHLPEEGHHLNDIVQLLSSYYTITR